MARDYTVFVDHPDGSGQVAIEPGEEIPSWARDLVHERHLDAASDGPPPKSGKGSGIRAWVEYASGKVEVDDDASRDDIIAALEDAGVPTE